MARRSNRPRAKSRASQFITLRVMRLESHMLKRLLSITLLALPIAAWAFFKPVRVLASPPPRAYGAVAAVSFPL